MYNLKIERQVKRKKENSTNEVYTWARAEYSEARAKYTELINEEGDLASCLTFTKVNTKITLERILNNEVISIRTLNIKNY